MNLITCLNGPIDSVDSYGFPTVYTTFSRIGNMIANVFATTNIMPVMKTVNMQEILMGSTSVMI